MASYLLGEPARLCKSRTVNAEGTLYLVFMLHASLKGLRQIVDNYFRGGNSSEETEDKS